MSTLAVTWLYAELSSVRAFHITALYQPLNYTQVVANEGQRIDIPDGCVLENSA